MNFKKPKEQVARDAANRAQAAITYNLRMQGGGNLSSVGYVVTQAITEGINVAILSMIEDVYTDVEFEEDLNLRNKL